MAQTRAAAGNSAKKTTTRAKPGTEDSLSIAGMPPRALGWDWVNLSVIRDYSTGHRLFEIHLAIDLKTEATARAIEGLIESRLANDVEAADLKRALRAHVGSDMNESKARMIDAIMFPR